MQTASDSISTTLERQEARAWADFYRAAGAAEVEANGVRLIETGGATAAIASRVDVLTYNRVLGVGSDPRADGAATLDDITAVYAAAGARRFFVQLPPTLAGRLHDALEVRGFRYHNDWVKLHRGVTPPPQAETDLRVEQIGAEHARAFGEVFVASFDWPQTLAPWIGAPVGRHGWRHYLAFDGDRPVATAAMYMEGTCAWIDFASTLPDYRGRGAQGALTARRIEDCARLGGESMVVETAAATPEKRAPSLRNMQRMGFEVAYLRPNYLLELG